MRSTNSLVCVILLSTDYNNNLNLPPSGRRRTNRHIFPFAAVSSLYVQRIYVLCTTWLVAHMFNNRVLSRSVAGFYTSLTTGPGRLSIRNNILLGRIRYATSLYVHVFLPNGKSIAFLGDDRYLFFVLSRMANYLPSITYRHKRAATRRVRMCCKSR